LITVINTYAGAKCPLLKGFNLAEKGLSRTYVWKMKPDKFQLEFRHIFLAAR